MRRRPHINRPSRLQAEDGFTMVEVLVSAVILTVGLLGVVFAFASARKLTLLSERRTTMAHRAQLELERLEATPYAELAMIKTPPTSSEASNPDYYVKSGSPAMYQYGKSETESEELVLAAKEEECTSSTATTCGVISTSPVGRNCSTKVGACEWGGSGVLKGDLYDFVTWPTDKACTLCASKKYKRVTVVVTVEVPSGSRKVPPVRVSTLVAEA